MIFRVFQSFSDKKKEKLDILGSGILFSISGAPLESQAEILEEFRSLLQNLRFDKKTYEAEGWTDLRRAFILVLQANERIFSDLCKDVKSIREMKKKIYLHLWIQDKLCEEAFASGSITWGEKMVSIVSLGKKRSMIDALAK